MLDDYTLYLVMNGLSKHLTPTSEFAPYIGDSWNETNVGGGIAARKRNENKVNEIALGTYLNSIGRPSNYITFGQNWDLLKGMFGNLSGGYTTGLASGYVNKTKDGLKPIPAVPMFLPSLRYETPGGNWGVNLKGTPRIGDLTPAVLMLNFDRKLRD